MTKPILLHDTDSFLVQRPKTGNQSGFGKYNSYRISAEDVALYSAAYLDGITDELKGQLEIVEKQLDQVVNGILSDLAGKTDFLMFQDQRNQVKFDELDEEIIKVNKRVDDSLAKSAIFYYYHLKPDDTDIEQGDMWCTSNDTPAADFSTTDRIYYFLEGHQDFGNITTGETLELTCQQGLVEQGNAFLTHRAVFEVGKKGSRTSDIKWFEVTPLKVMGQSGLPYYQEGLINPTRSDFYPIFTITKKELDDKLDLKYDKSGGEIKGDVTISPETSGFPSTLKMTEGVSSNIHISDQLNIISLVGTQIFKLRYGDGQDGSVSTFYGNLDINNNRITRLSNPQEEFDAVTKQYVDDLFEQNDVKQDDLFTPGDKVAASSEAKTKGGGFYFYGGTLYFKEP